MNVYEEGQWWILSTVIQKMKAIYFQIFASSSFEKFKTFFQSWQQMYFIPDSISHVNFIMFFYFIIKISDYFLSLFNNNCVIIPCTWLRVYDVHKFLKDLYIFH